jgi:hypothetical protein
MVGASTVEIIGKGFCGCAARIVVQRSAVKMNFGSLVIGVIRVGLNLQFFWRIATTKKYTSMTWI